MKVRFGGRWGSEPCCSLPGGVQTGSAGLENNRQYLVRVRMYLLHVRREIPKVPLLNSFPTETQLTGVISMLQRREIETQLTGLTLSPTSQLSVTVIFEPSTQTFPHVLCS